MSCALHCRGCSHLVRVMTRCGVRWLVLPPSSKCATLPNRVTPTPPHPPCSLLPLMVGWFSLNVPSGLALYYFSNTVFTTGIQIWLRKLGGAWRAVVGLGWGRVGAHAVGVHLNAEGHA